MNRREQHVYVLTPNDVVRIRELLSMFLGAIDRIFDRTETTLHQDADEIMGDLDFYLTCNKPMEVDLDP